MPDGASVKFWIAPPKAIAHKRTNYFGNKSGEIKAQMLQRTKPSLFSDGRIGCACPAPLSPSLTHFIYRSNKATPIPIIKFTLDIKSLSLKTPKWRFDCRQKVPNIHSECTKFTTNPQTGTASSSTHTYTHNKTNHTLTERNRTTGAQPHPNLSTARLLPPKRSTQNGSEATDTTQPPQAHRSASTTNTSVTPELANQHAERAG